MINFLLKKYVPDYTNISHPKVREGYGLVGSVISILCNLFLCVIKLIAGTLSNSISIQADAFNNLSDAGSNVATLLGFQLATKQPDSDHPYGHGRYEYIMGLVISFLIFVVAFSSFKESISKIIEPNKVVYHHVTLVILIVSLVVKLFMAYLNNELGKRIDSPSLKGAGKDSLNDCVSTLATLVSILFNQYAIDGYIGIFVSIFVFSAGVDVFNDTVNPLLGQAPDPKLLQEIEAYVLSHERVIGVHDLMIHDYGPSRMFVTLHAEVKADEDILEAHDLIDSIERELSKKFHCLTTIHMDPIDVSNERTNEIREKVEQIIVNINSEYSIHDFRIVSGKTHTNLIFDVVLPAHDRSDEKQLKQKIYKEIKTIDPNFYGVVQIDHSY